MGALVLLLFLASSLYTCQSQAPSVESALNEIFDEGTLGNMDVSGSVKMETGTDLSFTVNTHIKNNGFGLNTDFSITDSRCDFRKVKLSAKSEVTLPDDVTRILNLLGVPSTITVADETMEVNFLPENATTLLSSQSFDISSLADPAIQSVLGIVGADATFTLKNVKFMTTGISFQLFMSASVFDPSKATACSTFKAQLQQLSPSLCTDSGGIEVGETNLGLQLYSWLGPDGAGQNVEYISPSDGTILVGSSLGSVCNLEPVQFKIEGNVGDLTVCATNPTKCSDETKQAIINAVNAGLPEGYKIDASQLSNVDVDYDPSTGDIKINGDMYAGAGKDPAALVDAIKKYVDENGSLNINGKDTRITNVDDENALQQCKISNGADAAVCNPFITPGSAKIQGTKGFNPTPSTADGEAADMSGDDDAKQGDQVMLVLGTVLITLAVVAAIVGGVMALKMFNKRRAVVSAGNFQTFQHSDGLSRRGVAMPADAFDSVIVQQESRTPVVWGDVVKAKTTEPSDIA